MLLTEAFYKIIIIRQNLLLLFFCYVSWNLRRYNYDVSDADTVEICNLSVWLDTHLRLSQVRNNVPGMYTARKPPLI